MFKIYKAEKVNLGEPKPIKHIDIKLVKSSKKESSLQCDEKNKNQVAEDIIKQAKMLYADIIDEANSEAFKIIENANIEIKARKTEEFEGAYKEGLEKGYNEGKLEAETIINQAKSIKEFFLQRKGEIFKDAETEIVELVLEISKKVIGQELKQNNEIIISLVKQALERSAYKSKISIKVSAEDYKYVLENKDLIESLVEGVSEIEIIEDKFLVKGDCIVDTPGGQINSSIRHQMKELEEAFIYVLRNE